MKVCSFHWFIDLYLIKCKGGKHLVEHKINKKYKDRVFRVIFHEKKDLLELYNAINDSNYTNPDDLTITTIEDVVYMGMKNDLSFIIGDVMNLYEHQSSFSPNLPLSRWNIDCILHRHYIFRSHSILYFTMEQKRSRNVRSWSWVICLLRTKGKWIQHWNVQQLCLILIWGRIENWWKSVSNWENMQSLSQ